MARYIDADKLSLELAEELEKNNIPRRNAKSNIPYLLNLGKINYALFLLSVTETEDVAPVVHAHWIPRSRLKHILYYLQTGQDFCYCSNCTSCGNKLMRHCPTCGAKMDEEVE